MNVQIDAFREYFSSQILENIPDAIIIVNEQGTIEKINSHTAKMFGYAASEIVGKPPETLIPERFQKIHVQHRKHYYQHPHTRSMGEGLELLGRRKNGDEFSVDISLSSFNVQHQTFIIAVIRDVSEKKRIELQLRKAEEQYRNVVQNIDEIIYSVKQSETMKTGEVRFVSNHVENILGFHPQEFQDNPNLWFSIIHPHDISVLEQSTKQLAETKRPHTRIYRIRHKHTGEYRWMEDRPVPQLDAAGKMIGIFGTARDITEKKLINEQMELLYAAMNQTEDCVSITDTNGVITYINPAFTLETGYTKDDAIGQTPRILKSGAHDKKFYETLWKTILSGNVFNATFINKHKNGTFFYEQKTITPIKDEKGNITHFVSTAKNITEQKKLEEKLREQVRLLNVAQDAIFVIDLENSILYWNEGAERLYEWKSEEVLGKKSDDILYKKFSEKRTEAIHGVLREGIWNCELHQQTRSGKTIFVESHLTLVRDEDGNAKSILVVNNDITEKKKLEEQLIRAQKMESIGTLAGGIAHDFNNILTIIMGHAQILERKKFEDAALKKSIENILLASNRATGLVKQLLTFARKSESEFVPVVVNSVVEETAKMIGETFPKTIALSLHLDNQLPPIIADANQLYQSVLNLCVNARDAMPQGGTLAIKTEFITGERARTRFIEAIDSNYICIIVNDTGTGMSEETKRKIFEPFFTTKDVGKGTGLGLSTVYGIVKNHNGFIDVESELGKGTTFSLCFPMQPHLREKTKEEKIPADDAFEGNETILVVEDEALLRELVTTILETAGYTILQAKDGSEAIEQYALHSQEISLVLCDIGLPKIGGADVLTYLKQKFPEVNVVFASGYIEPNLKSELLKKGAKAFIQKPYRQNEMLQTIRDILDLKK
jgi:PAS domain S-box-containing protein